MILRDELKKAVLKQQDDLKRDLGIIRDPEVKLLPKFATIISGIRRCGKSTLARQYLKDIKTIYYVHFEDINLTGFELEDFLKLEDIFKEVAGKEGTYFFDEIQNIQGWERYVRQLVDKDEKVIITGSNATMLSKELGTKLTGRHITKELYPFSYTEFLKLREQQHNIALFEEYLKKGGFPEYLKSDDPEILKNLFLDIFYRDIMQRNELRNETAIKTLLHYAISNIGKETSYNKLKTLIGVGSANTISQFIDHFEQAYLLFAIRKFDYSIKKQIIAPKKLYCVDNAIIGQNAFSFSENKGRILENTVFIQLRREDRDIYYHKGKYECDFLVKNGNTITQAIQVCYELNLDNKKREINGILEALETHQLKEGLLLTFDQEDLIKMEGKNIHIIPVWKWLLEKSAIL